jgi:pilin/secretion family protein with methylation motif
MQPLKNQSGFTAFELIIVLFLFAFLLIAIYFAYLNSPESKPATKPLSTPVSICDFRNNDIGCGLNSFTVKAPSSGQQICVDGTFEVKWTAPSDMEAVTVTVRPEGAGQEYSLGTFPAAQKQYQWLVNNVPPGDVYKLWINSDYKGTSVNNESPGLFTIKNCPTGSPSPSPTS